MACGVCGRKVNGIREDDVIGILTAASTVDSKQASVISFELLQHLTVRSFFFCNLCVHVCVHVCMHVCA